jgi:transcriptional regulator with XRE-family HTH domain
MDIVLKLRELRRLRGLTQKEAAMSSGIGVKTLSSFETGERITSMKLRQLLQLLEAYDTTAAEFFGDGVERRLFGDSVGLTTPELQILAAWRALPEPEREPTTERILLMIEEAASGFRPRLRAIS